jgi:hypothetical protein
MRVVRRPLYAAHDHAEILLRGVQEGVHLRFSQAGDEDKAGGPAVRPVRRTDLGREEDERLILLHSVPDSGKVGQDDWPRDRSAVR